MSRMKKYMLIGAIFGLVAPFFLGIALQSAVFGLILYPIFFIPGYLAAMFNLLLFGGSGVFDAPAPFGFVLFLSFNVIFYMLVGALIAWLRGS